MDEYSYINELGFQQKPVERDYETIATVLTNGNGKYSSKCFRKGDHLKLSFVSPRQPEVRGIVLRTNVGATDSMGNVVLGLELRLDNGTLKRSQISRFGQTRDYAYNVIKSAQIVRRK